MQPSCCSCKVQVSPSGESWSYKCDNGDRGRLEEVIDAMHFEDEELLSEDLARLSYHMTMVIRDAGPPKFEADRVEKGPACRFHRKFGEDRFLTVTVRTADGARLTRRLRKQCMTKFLWLGREWCHFRSKVEKKDKKHRKDPAAKRSMKFTFFATRGWTEKEEQERTSNEFMRVFWRSGSPSMSLYKWNVHSVQTAYQTHIPVRVKSSCAPTCRQHFLCRCEGKTAYPEHELKSNGKYAKRIDLAFTAAYPTIQFDSHQIYEEDDLMNLGFSQHSCGMFRFDSIL